MCMRVCACVRTYMCTYVNVCAHLVYTLIFLLTDIIQVVKSLDRFILDSSPSSLMLSLSMTTIYTGGRKDSPSIPNFSLLILCTMSIQPFLS